MKLILVLKINVGIHNFSDFILAENNIKIIFKSYYFRNKEEKKLYKINVCSATHIISHKVNS